MKFHLFMFLAHSAQPFPFGEWISSASSEGARAARWDSHHYICPQCGQYTGMVCRLGLLLVGEGELLFYMPMKKGVQDSIDKVGYSILTDTHSESQYRNIVCDTRTKTHKSSQIGTRQTQTYMPVTDTDIQVLLQI